MLYTKEERMIELFIAKKEMLMEADRIKESMTEGEKEAFDMGANWASDCWVELARLIRKG